MSFDNILDKMQVQIVSCYLCDFESEIINKNLEGLGIQTIKHRVVEDSDILNLLDGTNIFEGTNFLILCSHGGDENDSKVLNPIPPINSCNKPNDIYVDRNQIRLKNFVVISTACFSGNTYFWNTFKKAEVKKYIAPKNDINTADILYFLHNLFYNIKINDILSEELFNRINAMIKGKMVYYSAKAD